MIAGRSNEVRGLLAAALRVVLPALLLSAPLSRCLAQTELTSLIQQNYHGYILDAYTASPDYSNIEAQVQYQVANSSATVLQCTSVVSFRLIDTNTLAAHPIYDYGNETINPGYTYNITNVLAVGGNGTANDTEDAYIRPAAWMSQFTGFYIECTLYTNGVAVGSQLTTDPERYYHFTNTVSGDDSYNVLLNFTGDSWTRSNAVITAVAAGQNTFQAQVNYEVHRWDDFDAAHASAGIPIIFNYSLKDSTGNTVPLVNDRQVFVDPVFNWAAASVPTVDTFAKTLDIQPAVQLDSVGKTYYLTVIISHTNNPVTGQVLTANTEGTTTNQLLHFNGNLSFGPVATTISSLTGAAGRTPDSGDVQTVLTTVSGTVAGDAYSGNNITVDLDSAGNATVIGGTASLNSAYGNVAGVNYQRSNGVLTSSGGSADITVTLPTGFGYRLNDISSQVLQSRIPFTGVPLKPTLAPDVTDLVYSPGSTIYAVEESKPVWLVANQITWHLDSGTFDIPPAGAGAIYVRKSGFDYLSAVSNLLVNPPEMGDKRSNDKYWYALSTGAAVSGDSTIQPDPSSNALLTADFIFDAGSLRTHFPYDTPLQWSGGEMRVTNDVATYGGLQGVSPVSVAYDPACPGCGSSSVGLNSVTLQPAGSQLAFTADGGLVATGAITAGQTLKWGAINGGTAWAQEAQGFTDGAYEMPGLFVRGDENTLSPEEGPAAILYTGFEAADPSVVERPLTAGYSAGLADYAGMNFRCGVDGAHSAVSTIGGTTTDPWLLTGRSKYYVRYAGVTGIHEAVPGSFPSSLTLWGYPFTFSNYGVSYVDSQNHDSLTDGEIALPPPSDFVQAFDNLKFSCLGAPVSGDVPDGDGFKVMAYWNADFLTHSIQFKSPSACSPDAGYLVLGIEGYASHVDKPLYGQVGFFNDGDQIPASFGLAGVTSRLKLPNVITFDGPTNTTYTLTPCQDAYYNRYADAPPGPTPGWINVFGKLDVPFFDDLQLQMQTSCHTNGVEATNALIYLSGGWPRPGSDKPQHGWVDAASGKSPFEMSLFDPTNRGWPDASGLTIANYRDNSNGEDYHPRAQRLWLGVVNFDYPLSWSTTLRTFDSLEAVTNNLLIVHVQHQIKYLDPQNAYITFGAQYDGLPVVSIENLAFTEIDKATGAGDALSKAVTGAVADKLISGLDDMNEMLNTKVDKLLEPVFANTLDPDIDNFYANLCVAWSSIPPSQRSTAVAPMLVTNLYNLSTNLTADMEHLCDAADKANDLIGKLQDDIEHATNAIEAVIGPGGLLEKVDGKRPALEKLGQFLTADNAPKFAKATLGPAYENAIQKLDPRLDEITERLKKTEELLEQVEDKLDDAGEFTEQLTNILYTHKADLEAISLSVSNSVTEFVNQLNYWVDDPCQPGGATDLKEYIHQKLADALYASTPVYEIQELLRQQLYDIDAALNEQIDSVFQGVNDALRDVISQSLAGVDDSINKCLGDVGDAIGSGDLNGHAIIDGDSLRELRIDGHFEFEVPKDHKLDLNAFLLIKELNSDGNDGCSSSHTPFTEVTIGADKVPVHWLSPDLEANVEAKFTFDDVQNGPTESVIPVNLGGQVELIGELDYEDFKLHDLAAGLAFGKYEDYLALRGGVKFNGYDFSGAIFFGRTCTLDPLKLIDPDVASVLGDPPFTGAYCYAQGWLPISEMMGIPPSCAFKISAGVGAGAFYFSQGPTYGGKIFLGVSGELLCIINVDGELKMIGVKSGSELSYQGRADFKASVGKKPFVLKVHKDLCFTYSHKHFHRCQ